MNAEFVTLEGKKYAVVPLAMWKRLQETIEDLQDAIEAKAISDKIARGEMEVYPSEFVDRLLLGDENKLKVWREYRGLTQEALAAKINKSVELIRKIENGKSEGSIGTIKAIAKVLSVDISLLV